jgi:hypothetical protein
VRIALDDGRSREVIELCDPGTGLHVPPMTWCTLFAFSPGAVLLVLASELFSEDDYIRNYEAFLAGGSGS